MIIKDRVFLVTGGGSGLGSACVKHLNLMGAKVGFMDLKVGPDMEGYLSENEDKTVFLQGSVSSVNEVLGALKKLDEQKWGHLCGVINCAGIATAKKLLSKEGEIHPLSSFEKTINVNLIGTFNVCRLVAQHMIQQSTLGPGEERGVFILTASVAAFEGQIGQTAYSASKGGVMAMALPMARELASYGIRVCTIAPGIFDTPMLQGLDEKVRDALGKMVPFPPRLGRPEEYAKLAQHVIENEMLNGEVIRLDGSIRMQPR